MNRKLRTRERIEKAINEMHAAGSRMTILGVAREAGVSNATVHNRYPDLASRIRELSGKAAEFDAKAALSKRRGTIKYVDEQRRALRNELDEKNEELRKADSANASLDLENQSLNTEVEDLKRQLSKALRGSLACGKRSS